MYSGAALYVLGAGAYATGYNVIGPMIFAAEDAKLNAAARAAAALENQGRPAPGAPCKTEAGGGGDKGRLAPGGVAEAGEEAGEEDEEPAEGFRIVEQEGDIVELAGKIGEHQIRVLANMSREGETLYLRQAHIEGPGSGRVGVKGLFDAVKQFGRSQGVRNVVVEGAKRTTVRETSAARCRAFGRYGWIDGERVDRGLARPEEPETRIASGRN